MKTRQSIHDSIVHSRRVRVLHSHLTQLLPEQGLVLDVGCGDGLLAAQLAADKPGLSIQGIDIDARADAKIEVTVFDGVQIPREDASVDVVMFVDVLHHTDDPLALLREAKRVAREAILIKDHLRNGFLAQTTLRFMDWVGNAHHDVPLPYNYWSKQEWHDAFDTLELSVGSWQTSLHLYPLPADWLFGRSLHFIASLNCSE